MRCLNCQAVHTDTEIEMEDGCCPSCGSTYFDTGIEKDADDAFFDDEIEEIESDEDELKDFFDEGFFDDIDYDEDEDFEDVDYDEDEEDY